MKKWLGTVAATILAVCPSLAEAQDCYAIRSTHADADQRGRNLVEKNPGTALVAFGCMTVAKSQFDQTGMASDAAGTFAVCGAFGCGFTDSYQNCITVGTEIVYQAIRLTATEQRMRQEGCRR